MASGPGLRLAVADDRADEQVRVVERRAVGVRERVAELAALVDRARRLGRDVAGDAARERELAEQLAHALLVAGDGRVDLAVGPLEVGVGDDAGPAVAGADDVDRVEVPAPDDAVHVRVDQVEARRRAPVAEQARLDVLGQERLPEQRVVEQVDLADREVVGGAPVGVDQPELIRRERVGCGCVDHLVSLPVRFRTPAYAGSIAATIPAGVAQGTVIAQRAATCAAVWSPAQWLDLRLRLPCHRPASLLHADAAPAGACPDEPRPIALRAVPPETGLHRRCGNKPNRPPPQHRNRLRSSSVTPDDTGRSGRGHADHMAGGAGA